MEAPPRVGGAFHLHLDGFGIAWWNLRWPVEHDLSLVALLRSQASTPPDFEIVREINVVRVSKGEVAREPDYGARSGDADDPPLDETASAVP